MPNAIMQNIELGPKIGQGGMGVVYKGHHRGLDRDVAVKFLHAHLMDDGEAVDRFLREARIVARLDHPNIVGIYDTGMDDDGRPYFVMEYLEGEVLRSRLRRGPMPEREAVGITCQVLRALDRAHSMGVVHRDIKSANIFLCRDKTVKLVDFGIAKRMEGTQLTQNGFSVGTPEYMSPEQAEALDLDGRSDLYSLGIVLFEMLSGHVPFSAQSPVAVLKMQVDRTLPELPNDVSPQVRRALEGLVQKDRNRRTPSAAAALKALTESPVADPVPPPKDRSLRSPSSSGSSRTTAGAVVEPPIRKSPSTGRADLEAEDLAGDIATRKLSKSSRTGAKPALESRRMPWILGACVLLAAVGLGARRAFDRPYKPTPTSQVAVAPSLSPSEIHYSPQVPSGEATSGDKVSGFISMTFPEGISSLSEPDSGRLLQTDNPDIDQNLTGKLKTVDEHHATVAFTVRPRVTGRKAHTWTYRLRLRFAFLDKATGERQTVTKDLGQYSLHVKPKLAAHPSTDAFVCPYCHKSIKGYRAAMVICPYCRHSLP